MAMLSEITGERQPLVLLSGGLTSTGHAFDMVGFHGSEAATGVEEINLTFGDTLPPGMVAAYYSDADVEADGEAELVLMRWTGTA